MTDEQSWTILTTITPSEDGRFAKINLELYKANNRVPVRVNLVGSKDLLYEQVQGEFNNVLRLLMNDYGQQFKSMKHNKGEMK